MVGDINMFLPDGTDGDAECEIMIACESTDPLIKDGRLHAELSPAPSDRRKGFAREALNLLCVKLSYTSREMLMPDFG